MALAAYERKAAAQGQHNVLITQNIDRLHQAAGSANVVEMHGSLWCGAESWLGQLSVLQR